MAPDSEPPDLTAQITFQVSSPVDGGGCADIWKGVWDSKSMKSMVAVKVLRAHTYLPTRKDKMIKRLRRELRLWQRLDHKNILPLSGVTYHFGSHASMVCPWQDNGNLLQYLERHPDACSLSARLEILHGVASGLSYLHSFGIVHGDLNPKNILISSDGRPLISDFGLAQMISDVHGSTYFTTTIGCTVRWAAIELYHFDAVGSSPTISRYSDVYSFGSVMFQLLSGRVPYHNMRTDFHILKALHDGLRPERPQGTWITDDDWNLIQKCWVMPPESRPTIDEVQGMVQQSLENAHNLAVASVDIVQVQDETIAIDNSPSSSTISSPDLSECRNENPIPGPSHSALDSDTEDVTPYAEAVQLLSGHMSEVFVCAWNKARPDLLATGSKDGIVNIWKLPYPTSRQASLYTGPPMSSSNFNNATDAADLTCIDWSPDGTLLAVGSYDSILRVLSHNGTLYFSSPQHKGPIFSVRFSLSGRWLLTGSLDGTSCIFDVKEAKLLLQYKAHSDCCLSVEWLDDFTFASCGADAKIYIMNVYETKPLTHLLGHSQEVNQIMCNPARTRLASCSDDTTARIWDISEVISRSPRSTSDIVGSAVVLKGHTQSISSIRWHPVLPFGQNELVATCAFDGCAGLWDSVTGACLTLFRHHTRPVYALSFSPDGRFLATAGGDGYLHVYNVDEKKKKWSWFAGSNKPGIFELDWQQSGRVHRIAIALEKWSVGVVEVSRVPPLQNP